MPTITLSANGNGTFNITRTGDVAAVDGSAQVSQWTLSGRQLAKHLRGIANPNHPFNALSPGDKSAALDAANAAVAAPLDPELP